MDRVASRAPIGLALLWLSRGRPGMPNKCIHDVHKLRCSLEQCFEDRQAARDLFKSREATEPLVAAMFAIERDARDDGAEHELQEIAVHAPLDKLLAAQDAEAAEHLPFQWQSQ